VFGGVSISLAFPAPPPHDCKPTSFYQLRLHILGLPARDRWRSPSGYVALESLPTWSCGLLPSWGIVSRPWGGGRGTAHSGRIPCNIWGGYRDANCRAGVTRSCRGVCIGVRSIVAGLLRCGHGEGSAGFRNGSWRQIEQTQ
jgi:hypothetical protein